MPALFAYLIAVGLLLGGGYGALSWLAAPEPAKVVAKAKPKPPPHYEASSEATSFERSSSAINDGDQVTSGSNHPPSSAQTEASVAASEQGAQPQSSGPSQAQQGGAANAEVSSAEARQEVRPPAPAVSPVPADNAQPATSAAVLPATAARPMKRSHPRQASSRSERSALALMTLRTIEFPDGRRVTQLIPYRNGERALAFPPDE
jgi:cytoskeletal protein RodZ